MPTGKTCGNCKNFTRIKIYWFQQGGRNGICDILDYNCNSDSSYAKQCKKYKRKNIVVIKRKLMMKKLQTKMTAGSEFLPPLSIEEATNNLLFGDRVFGDGKMTEDEAKELVILYREEHKENL